MPKTEKTKTTPKSAKKRNREEGQRKQKKTLKVSSKLKVNVVGDDKFDNAVTNGVQLGNKDKKGVRSDVEVDESLRKKMLLFLDHKGKGEYEVSDKIQLELRAENVDTLQLWKRNKLRPQMELFLEHKANKDYEASDKIQETLRKQNVDPNILYH